MCAALVLLAGCGIPGRELLLRPTVLHPADAIVVLGNRPPRDASGRITEELERRVRRGVELYQRGLAPVIVMTGGPSARGVEADVMAEHARALGVPAGAIVRERRARDTAENARLSVELLCRDGPCPPRVIVVSSPYHLRRAVALFRCAGAHVQYAATELPPDESTRITQAAYEYAVRLAYIVDDACARARARPRPSMGAAPIR